MLYPAWMTKWKQRHTFKLEIAGVLLLKGLLLMGIWYLFFSDPLQDHLNDRLMGEHLVGTVHQHHQ